MTTSVIEEENAAAYSSTEAEHARLLQRKSMSEARRQTVERISMVCVGAPYDNTAMSFEGRAKCWH
jgi:hypothetical protein